MNAVDAERAMGAVCPVCNARNGLPCVSRSRKRRRSYHRARVNAGRHAASRLDCVSCGACCYSRPWWMYSSEGEQANPPADVSTYVFTPSDENTPPELEVPIPPGRVIEGDGYITKNRGRALRVVDGRCVALQVEAGRSSCSIYERRPIVCRQFPKGGWRCYVIRQRSIDPPTVFPAVVSV